MSAAPGIVAPYADTPFPEDTICADLHLQMITKAKRYLYLTTPYLVIDETLSAALCTAARSGVDVRIMTPHIPDKKVVFAVTQSNYPTLLEAGARIFEFTPGFLHSKTVVADDLYASVGSCNLDYRSFYLQFENGVWMYRETKDSQTNIFIPWLNKGTYVIGYDVYVTNPGTFDVGIATLQCQYAPQFTAHSAGCSVAVK